MVDAKLSVNDLMQFLPDFRESLNIREIAFSLLAKSVIRLDQCASLTNGPANDEKVERLVKLLQALEMSPAKPSGVHHFIVSLRETGENNHIKGHVDLLSKISSVSSLGEEELYEDSAPKAVPRPLPPPPQKSIAIPRPPQKTIADPPPLPLPTKSIADTLPPVPPPKPPPPAASGSSSPTEDMYHAAVAGVQPAKPKEDLASAPPSIAPAKSPASDEDGYESWPGTTAKDLSNDDIGDKLYIPTPKHEELYEDIPTYKHEETLYDDFSKPKNEEEIYKTTGELTTESYADADYSTEEEEEEEEDEEEEEEEEEDEEEEEEEEEDPYQDITNMLSDQQKKSLQLLTEDKQDTTASDGKYSPEEYHPLDSDSALSDYIHHGVPHDSTGKPPLKTLTFSVGIPPLSSVTKPPLKSPTSNVISDGVEVHNDANMAAEVTNKDDKVAKRLQDPSTSDTTVSEHHQSLVAEEDGNTKTQKSQMTKAHKLEMKDLDLKYKTEMKQLQLKQEEETLAMKVEINKLKSELNGVCKQNSKLAEHMKKSCKREEMFDQVVTLLQDTVSNLQTEMNELLATLESTKEKLKKYESVAT